MTQDTKSFSRLSRVFSGKDITTTTCRSAQSPADSPLPMVAHRRGLCHWSSLVEQAHTVILTVVDRFSKAVHFMALTKLPSAAEMGALLVQHVFRLHES